MAGPTRSTCEQDSASEGEGTVRPQIFMYRQQRLTRDRTVKLREMLAAAAKSPE